MDVCGVVGNLLLGICMLRFLVERLKKSVLDGGCGVVVGFLLLDIIIKKRKKRQRFFVWCCVCVLCVVYDPHTHWHHWGLRRAPSSVCACFFSHAGQNPSEDEMKIKIFIWKSERERSTDLQRILYFIYSYYLMISYYSLV